ncbi:Uncharacterised protein [Mycobacterium tuberculosis]|uniref:Uncharacterized protein n=1 Tax=Mycobacterium tuberculosis TaxID=1773 RepID=A0A654TU89_MYCTX|nr:Uncharacterised protein [Mycobacterium tuberculosis]CKP32801.1 Uncharacterised protein [Mycobacterium tuberculosis]CKS98734.1 Uncharacterised protein [Mycobacterium tuberculosis]CKT46043.1 Uncharacterised protein [Mycobacterium tuberculosis]
MVPGVPSYRATPAIRSSRMAVSPVSAPTGLAAARHILMPLYAAGLWLAVNIAPGQSNSPEAK